MAITIDDLKVGETYLSDEGYERTILGIGESSVFYKDRIFETISSIDSFIKCHHIKLKPKKTIELVGFLNFKSGDFQEVLEGSYAYFDNKSKRWRQVSTRTIEIDE